MAKQVDHMMDNEKYRSGSKAEIGMQALQMSFENSHSMLTSASPTESWLTTYTEANPKRSVYAFYIDPKHPGYFYLCFKPGQHAQSPAMARQSHSWSFRANEEHVS